MKWAASTYSEGNRPSDVQLSCVEREVTSHCSSIDIRELARGCVAVGFLCKVGARHGTVD